MLGWEKQAQGVLGAGLSLRVRGKPSLPWPGFGPVAPININGNGAAESQY